MAAKKDDETVLAVILRDYWDADEARHCAGEIVEVSKDALIDGMEKGILARAPE